MKLDEVKKLFRSLSRYKCSHHYQLTVLLPLGTCGGRTYYAVEERCRKCDKEISYVQPINRKMAEVLAAIGETHDNQNVTRSTRGDS